MSFKPTTGWRSKIRVLDVGDHALEFSSKGYLIIGIFPDLKAEDATTLFKTLYLSHQKQNKIKAQRFRYGKGTWFALIEAFENTVLSANHAEKDFSNHYIPYKKLMDGITVQLTPWNNCRHD